MPACNVKNRTIFRHDNLEVLQGMNSECIDLIYLDPPFNKNKVFTAPIGSSAEGAAFEDIFKEEVVEKKWSQAIQESHESVHNFLNAIEIIEGKQGKNFCYLAYMAIRLVEMHRILKDTGSMFLHCDPTMSHYLKLLMDMVFGERNFRNEIVWGYEKPRSSSRIFRRNHDIILFYSKGTNYTFHVQRVPTLKGDFELRKSFKRPDGTVWHPKAPGKQAGSWWYDIPSFATRMGAKERTGYPTQKPIKLLERIILASTNEGDLVLDPFCGCATTCIAAETLGRQWIGIDVSQKTHNLAKERFEKEIVQGDSRLAERMKSIDLRLCPPTRTRD